MARKPRFQMQDAHKLKRLKNRWRRPRGKDSKMRRQMIGYCASPAHGYSSPLAIRGKVDGLNPVIVANMAQLGKVDPKNQIAIISAKVGTRIRLSLLKVALEKNIRVHNFKNIEKVMQVNAKMLADRKALRQSVLAKRSVRKESKKEEKEKKDESKESKLEEAISEEEKKKAEKQEKDKVLIHKE